MQYIENSRIQLKDGLTIVTNVTYTFDDGQQITIDIPHFNPMDEDYIKLGIQNRYITEQRKLFPDLDAQVDEQVNNYINTDGI